MSKSARRILISILAIALLLRIALGIFQPATPQAIDRLPDQREYLSLAQNLLHGGGLYFVDPRFHQPIYAYRMPGYPAFLAACGASVVYARLAQCIIDVSTVLAVFLITRSLLLGRAVPSEPKACTRVEATALIATAFVAFNPFYIYFSNLLLSEMLFAALLTWGIYFLTRPLWTPFIFGIPFLIAAAYVKTTGLLMFPAVVFAYFLNFSPPPAYPLADLRRAFRDTVTACLLFLFSFMFPWAWRNHHILGHWAWTTTNSGATLYDGFHPGATGASDQRFITLLPGLMSMNEVQRSDFLAGSAADWAKANWTSLPALSAVKILRGWSPVPLSADFGKPVYRLISAAYTVPFDLLCLVGLFSPRLKRRAKLLLVMPALVVTLGQVLSVGSMRYTMPAEATLAIVAAVGAMDLVSKVSKRKFEERNPETVKFEERNLE